MNLVFSVLDLLVIVVALKAKPLGNVPYRWGVYMGGSAALLALRLILYAVAAMGDRTQGIAELLVILIAALAALGSVGLLLRRKFGIMALAVAYAVLLAAARFLDAQGIFPSNPRYQPLSTTGFSILLGAFAVYAFANAVYFKERWKLLAP
ncbi:MAG TPA: hypothetical protein VMH81_32080 [Bryobacteraceae bacterium]|nr:hypothetical protein [Bryobacteraceae bacterium]